MAVGGIAGEISRDLAVLQDDDTASGDIAQVGSQGSVGDRIPDDGFPVEVQSEEADGLVRQGRRIHKGILEHSPVPVNRAADLIVGGIPEIGVHHRDDPLAGLVHVLDHIGRGLAASDDIGIQVIGHPHLHLQAGRRQVDPEDEHVLHLGQGGLQVDVRLVHAGGDQEGGVVVHVADGSGLRHQLAQFSPGDIAGIRNVLRSGRKLLAPADRGHQHQYE